MKIAHDNPECRQDAATKEYDLTVAVNKEALTDFDDHENWSTHDEVFAELRDRNGIKSLQSRKK